jgi:DNA-directed RNA polymerase specialized sigma24 family protein
MQPETDREAPPPHQLQVDTELFAALREVNFTGPGWDHFATETARYAVDVLKSWLRKRTFAAELGTKHIPFRPTAGETDRLAIDRGYRRSIIDSAVGEALEKFREKARAGIGWSPQGGALIRTWFTTACVYEVINQLNARRSDAHRQHRAVGVAYGQFLEAARDPGTGGGGDPAQHVADQDVLREHLGSLSPRDRNIVWGRASNQTYKEIAELCGEVDGRAIDRRWQWLKANHDWIRRLDEKA